jgi:hypothetical protein
LSLNELFQQFDSFRGVVAFPFQLGDDTILTIDLALAEDNVLLGSSQKIKECGAVHVVIPPAEACGERRHYCLKSLNAGWWGQVPTRRRRPRRFRHSLPSARGQAVIGVDADDERHKLGSQGQRSPAEDRKGKNNEELDRAAHCSLPEKPR